MKTDTAEVEMAAAELAGLGEMVTYVDHAGHSKAALVIATHATKDQIPEGRVLVQVFSPGFDLSAPSTYHKLVKFDSETGTYSAA